MDINGKISTLRLDRGMTQAELAKATGYTSGSVITLIEKRERDIPSRKISAFAKVLGVSSEYLVSEKDDEEKVSAAPKSVAGYSDTPPNGEEFFFELISTLTPMNAAQRNKVLEYAKLIAAAEGK